ncbi:hypothetical protein GOP47_0027813 [Adiantum capillus-veneris]|nr:hypothetical protein GOP47_0027813 [Adiantum capillus-veneris]
MPILRGRERTSNVHPSGNSGRAMATGEGRSHAGQLFFKERTTSFPCRQQSWEGGLEHPRNAGVLQCIVFTMTDMSRSASMDVDRILEAELSTSYDFSTPTCQSIRTLLAASFPSDEGRPTTTLTESKNVAT